MTKSKKIIVKPKRIATRKQRKTTLDTSYLLDENKKVHKRVDNELITTSTVIPTTVKQKKTKKEYLGRKKDRKKIRENKRAKRLQGQQDYIKKDKKKKPKTSKPTPIGMEYTGFRYAGCVITPEEQQYIANDVLVVKEALEIMFNQGHNKMTIGSCCLIDTTPTPVGIDTTPIPVGIGTAPTPIGIEDKPTPTVDIFVQIEDYIMDIPDNVTTWRRGQKGYEWVDLQGFKMACVSIIREYSMSENSEIQQYFQDNEYAIKEAIDSFHEASSENDIKDYKQNLLNLLGMGRPLSPEQLDILSLFENY